MFIDLVLKTGAWCIGLLLWAIVCALIMIYGG